MRQKVIILRLGQMWIKNIPIIAYFRKRQEKLADKEISSRDRRELKKTN